MRPAPLGAPGGVLLPPGVGLHPLALVEKERGEGKEERGGAAPLLVLFGLGGRGRVACPGRPSSSPLGPINPRGGSGNPPELR